MLTNKQLLELKNLLEASQNPLFLFDNDADGLCAFLLLRRFIDRGVGVAIKSFPELDKSYIRKVNEFNPDCVFVLDKPLISKEFIEEIKKKNIPLIWLDHHDVNVNSEGIYYFNPMKSEKPSAEPTTYWAWQITKRKEDIWLAMIGCISDSFLPDFKEEFEKLYPYLWKPNIKTAFQGVYETEIGKLSRILGFGLKDRTSNVVKMIKFLSKVKTPSEILENSNHTMILRFEKINKKYQKLLEKAKKFAKNKLLYFQYGGDLSISADISNELIYLYPEKIIVVVYIKGNQANISLRGNNVREITLKAIEGIEGATGGGHKDATGAKMSVEQLPIFKEKIEKLIEERESLK
ncbi:MAG: DHH family phosphoesterase [Candidatus Pacearchaeota archaeon]